jgi:hypothetical protein
MTLLKSKRIQWLVAGVCILTICLVVFSKPFITAVLKRIIHHRLANQAGVDRLVLYHIIPPLPSPLLNKIFLGDAKKYYQGPITMGVDGMLFSLPANSKEIIIKKIL